MEQQQTPRRRSPAPLAIVGLALATGCVAQVPYSPQTGAIEAVGGREAAEQELSEILTRAVAPRIVEVDVQDEALVYSYSGGVHWGWYAGPREGGETLYWNNIQELQIYENDKVFINGPGGRNLEQIVFGNLSDCKRFGDLVWSFKSYDRGAAEPADGGGASSTGGTGEGRASGDASGGGAGGGSGEETHTDKLLDDEE